MTSGQRQPHEPGQAALSIEGGQAALGGPPRAQCEQCSLKQRRGGTILPATVGCVALEHEGLGVRATALLQALAPLLAAHGACPLHLPFEDHPDAYRSQDLEHLL